MTVVSNTSPINYLAIIGHAKLLQTLFNRIIIPRAVMEELTHSGAPDQLRQLLDPWPEWINVVTSSGHPLPGVEHLDRGEREVVEVGLATGADLVLIDEWQGRKAAERLGLTVVGTVGILDRAIRQGLADGTEVVDRLKKTTFRVSPRLMQTLETAIQFKPRT